MNINQALDRLRGGGPELNAIADAIGAAMREPVAFQFGPELDYVANHWPPQNPGKARIRPLFTLPPDAAGEIEGLRAKLHLLQSTSRHIANMLSNAERAGGETDRPEGARYITLSDTLARQIAKELNPEAPHE